MDDPPRSHSARPIVRRRTQADMVRLHHTVAKLILSGHSAGDAAELCGVASFRIKGVVDGTSRLLSPSMRTAMRAHLAEAHPEVEAGRRERPAKVADPVPSDTLAELRATVVDQAGQIARLRRQLADQAGM